MSGRKSAEKEQLEHSKHTWFNKHTAQICDDWDDRKREEISYESVALDEGENENVLAKAIVTYRRNVIDLMEHYFNSANLHEI